jgi:hypothetical protein
MKKVILYVDTRTAVVSAIKGKGKDHPATGLGGAMGSG